ncbi:hypothetical protein HYV79_03955 [Candidatus Woesearchaeota archaeon]|nr:hypothetical protein [Candidatus Woesearchaeota archaeon]
MVDQQLVDWMADKKDLIVPTLFKSVQFGIIKKLSQGVKLSENEKRYLRGKMKQKIMALQELMQREVKSDEVTVLLNNIGSYYVTGLEALKHNGYGWYYEPKFIEIINTKIEGILRFKDRTIKFIRVKSITHSQIKIDKETGLKYATNEQILKDVAFTKNQYTKMAWTQMFKRYGKMFVKIKKGKEVIAKSRIDYSKYGV